MKKLTTLVLAVLVATPSFASVDDTSRFINALADFVEHKIIDDEGLLRVIDACEHGDIANPVTDEEADTCTFKLDAFRTLQDYVDEPETLDATAICTWAKNVLSEQAKQRREREQTRKDTQLPWDEEEPEVLSAGGEHTCALKADRRVVCWGDNTYGQSTPPANLGVVRSVSAGDFLTCAVKADGSVACWGDNFNGRSTPPADLGVVRSVSADSFHTCAVKTDGTVTCWGWDNYGEGTPPADLSRVYAISAGEWHTCAAKQNGTVICWGRNTFGQSTPPADLGIVRSVSAGDDYTCAAKADRSVACWGANKYGQSTPPDGLRVWIGDKS